jgi:hypothetical protein
MKLCWIHNMLGHVVGWHWLTVNCADQDFMPLVDWLSKDGLVLSELSFHIF